MVRYKWILYALALVLTVVLMIGPALGEGVSWDCPECGRKGNTGKFCGGCGLAAPDQTTTQNESIPEPDDGIPELDERYPGIDMRLKTTAYAYTGPGKHYGGAGGYSAGQQTKVTAYFMTDTWVFVRIGYNENNMRYAYIPISTLENVRDLPTVDEMQCWEGKAAENVIPLTNPDPGSIRKSEYRLT